MSKKVLIVGAGGIIGKNLGSYLRDRGFSITNVVRTNKDEYNHLPIIEMDVTNSDKLLSTIADYDTVIWLVNNLVPQLVSNKEDDFDNNIKPIIGIYEKASLMPNLKKFVYISSGGTVYGNPDEHTPWVEDDFCYPISDYGFSKFISEKYIEYLSNSVHFDSVILRPANVYGPNFNLNKPQGIIGFILSAIKNNREIELYNMGTQVRDFIYVTDLCESIFQIIKDTKSKKLDTFNLGSNNGTSIMDVINLCEDVTGKKLMINHKPKRPIDCDYNVLNSNKFFKKYNFTPQTTLKKGIENTWYSIINHDS